MAATVVVSCVEHDRDPTSRKSLAESPLIETVQYLEQQLRFYICEQRSKDARSLSDASDRQESPSSSNEHSNRRSWSVSSFEQEAYLEDNISLEAIFDTPECRTEISPSRSFPPCILQRCPATLYKPSRLANVTTNARNTACVEASPLRTSLYNRQSWGSDDEDGGDDGHGEAAEVATATAYKPQSPELVQVSSPNALQTTFAPPTQCPELSCRSHNPAPSSLSSSQSKKKTVSECLCSTHMDQQHHTVQPAKYLSADVPIIANPLTIKRKATVTSTPPLIPTVETAHHNVVKDDRFRGQTSSKVSTNMASGSADWPNGLAAPVQAIVNAFKFPTNRQQIGVGVRRAKSGPTRKKSVGKQVRMKVDKKKLPSASRLKGSIRQPQTTQSKAKYYMREKTQQMSEGMTGLVNATFGSQEVTEVEEVPMKAPPRSFLDHEGRRISHKPTEDHNATATADEDSCEVPFVLLCEVDPNTSSKAVIPDSSEEPPLSPFTAPRPAPRRPPRRARRPDLPTIAELPPRREGFISHTSTSLRHLTCPVPASPLIPSRSSSLRVIHGPIRLELPTKEPAIDLDLDPSSFQLAISGPTGDYFQHGAASSAIGIDEPCVGDELISWFDSWGFENPGRWVRYYEESDCMVEPIELPGTDPEIFLLAKDWNWRRSFSSCDTASSAATVESGTERRWSQNGMSCNLNNASEFLRYDSIIYMGEEGEEEHL